MKRMFTTLKRFWPTCLLAAGLLLVVGGFIYDTIFAGIPYQDPTPEMSTNYARHSHIASTIRWCGVGIILLGIFLGANAGLNAAKNFYEKQIHPNGIVVGRSHQRGVRRCPPRGGE